MRFTLGLQDSELKVGLKHALLQLLLLKVLVLAKNLQHQFPYRFVLRKFPVVLLNGLAVIAPGRSDAVKGALVFQDVFDLKQPFHVFEFEDISIQGCFEHKL